MNIYRQALLVITLLCASGYTFTAHAASAIQMNSSGATYTFSIDVPSGGTCDWTLFLDGVAIELPDRSQPVFAQRLATPGKYTMVCTLHTPGQTPPVSSHMLEFSRAPIAPGTVPVEAAPTGGTSETSSNGQQFVADVVESQLRLQLADSRFHQHVEALAAFLNTVSATTTNAEISTGWINATEIADYERIRALVRPDYQGRSAIPAGFDVAGKWSKALKSFLALADASGTDKVLLSKNVAAALTKKNQEHEEFLDQLAEHMVRSGMTFGQANNGTTSGGSDYRTCGPCARQWRLRHCK